MLVFLENRHQTAATSRLEAYARDIVSVSFFCCCCSAELFFQLHDRIMDCIRGHSLNLFRSIVLVLSFFSQHQTNSCHLTPTTRIPTTKSDEKYLQMEKKNGGFSENRVKREIGVVDGHSRNPTNTPQPRRTMTKAVIIFNSHYSNVEPPHTISSTSEN
ncbi:hypothetical protein METSCH_A11490 [Metschnikowia aff. pulcherrima]|uniref:Uncharacterized protein n=1 Tax=Metschnikowia aff. pulcherrima TaxID=2163413 RepID=A0A4P6XLQ7_9ASCO|nr:hypothetical protein METSCH_A11490 [Metschnikowia aff. pulcherrima]